MSQHYDLGYDCAISGGRVDDNPYHYDCLEQYSWEAGFLDAMKWIQEDINFTDSLTEFLTGENNEQN